jgi:dihydrodipicolinate synthase/N-acetylneuraminate lyase
MKEQFIKELIKKGYTLNQAETLFEINNVKEIKEPSEDEKIAFWKKRQEKTTKNESKLKFGSGCKKLTINDLRLIG